MRCCQAELRSTLQAETAGCPILDGIERKNNVYVTDLYTWHYLVMLFIASFILFKGRH